MNLSVVQKNGKNYLRSPEIPYLWVEAERNQNTAAREAAFTRTKDLFEELSTQCHERTGLQVHVTPQAVEFSHPLMRNKVFNEKYPIYGSEIQTLFEEMHHSIKSEHQKQMAILNSLLLRGFTINKEDKRLVLTARDGSNMALPLIGSDQYLGEEVKSRVNLALQKYPSKPGKPSLAVPSKYASLDNKALIETACETMAGACDLVLMFDNDVLGLFMRMYEGPQNSMRNYAGLLDLAGQHPAVGSVRYPSYIVDLELRDKIPGANELNPKDRLRLMTPISTGEAMKNVRIHAKIKERDAFFDALPRIAFDAGGESHFLKGSIAGHHIVIETPSQHQFYEKLIERARSRAEGLSHGKVFETALMKARTELGHDAGEKFLLEIARDHHRDGSVIIVSDDRGVRNNIYNLNGEGKLHTKRGRGIGWISSLQLIKALDKDMGGKLVQELDRAEGYGLISSETGINSIMNDFNKDNKLVNFGGRTFSESYAEKMDGMRHPLLGVTSKHEEEPDLSEFLARGRDALQVMEEIRKRDLLKAFEKEADKHPERYRILDRASEIMDVGSRSR